MLLEQYAFQIWPWSMFNLEHSSRLLLGQCGLGAYGPGPQIEAKISKKKKKKKKKKKEKKKKKSET